MVLYTPLLMGAASGDAPIPYSMRELRGLISALAPVEGVCGTADFQVTQRALGANLSVDVNAGRAVVQGDAQAEQNKYIVRSTAGENLSTFDNGAAIAAPGSGTRTHLVYLQVRDRQFDGGDNYDARLAVAQDTGSGATLPPTAIPLAKLALTAGQTSIASANITDARPFARAVGVATTPAGTQPYYGFKSGTTDSGGYIQLTHTLGRKPTGCVATFSHPAPNTGAQATHVIADMTQATATQVRARVWQLQPYFTWVSKPVNISYICW